MTREEFLRLRSRGCLDFRGVDLQDEDLRGVELTKVDLTGANLQGADLRDVDLTGANLRYVGLRYADLGLGGPCSWGLDAELTSEEANR